MNNQVEKFQVSPDDNSKTWDGWSWMDLKRIGETNNWNLLNNIVIEDHANENFKVYK